MGALHNEDPRQRDDSKGGSTIVDPRGSMGKKALLNALLLLDRL